MMPEEQPLEEVERFEVERLELAPATPTPRTPVWNWQDIAIFFTFGFLLIIIVQVLLALAARILHFPPDNAALGIVGQAIAYLLVFVLLAGILRTHYNVPFWRSMGWVPSRLSVVASLASGVILAFGLAALGGLLRIPDVDSPINRLLKSRDSAVAVAIFGILIAPLAEELAFRGLVQPLLVQRMGVIRGIGLTAFVFGMLHWQQNARSWEYVGIISLAGAGFGVLRHVSGSTRTSILAHVAYNSTLFLAYFTYGRKSSI